MIPKINSSHGADTRNLINRAIEVLNQQGRTIQDLVAEGQLTLNQYATLIQIINGHLKSGEVDKYDLSQGLRAEINQIRNKIDKGDVSLNDLNPSVLDAINNGDGTPLEILSIPRERSVGAKETKFLIPSTNLFNPYKSKEGYLITFATGKISENPDYSTTELIEVQPYTNYTARGFQRVLFLNEDYQEIKTEEGAERDAVTFQTTSTSKYIRLHYVSNTEHNGYVSNRQINEGDELLDYEEFGHRLIDSKIDGNMLDEKSVKFEAIDFIEKTSNLFNPHKSKEGYAITIFSGGSHENPDYSTTGPIEVQPNSFYTEKGFQRVLFLNEDYQTIKTEELDGSIETFQTTSTSKYIRLHYVSNTGHDGYVSNRQINEGNELLPYEEHSFKFKDELNLKIDEVAIEKGTNLFDSNSVTYKKMINSSGVNTDNATYAASDFIPVRPNSIYTSYLVTYIAYYDSDKKIISRPDIYTPLHTFTTPTNCFYVRLSINTAITHVPLAVLNEGNRLLQTSTYQYKLDEDVLPSKNDYYMSDIPINGVFETSETYPDVSATLKNSTHDFIYNKYDELVDVYPEYVTKEFLGNNSTGLPIYLYKFKPSSPNANLITKTPKVFITTGTHGFEKMATWTVFLTMKDICEKWENNEHLEILRHNTEFLIIPIVNPWGYDNFARVNANYVDLNRNFPTIDWRPGTYIEELHNQYGGESPASELETQYVMSVFEDNPDIDIMHDYHTFAGADGWEHFIWIPAANTHTQHMAQNLISRLTRKWRKEYSFIPKDPDFFIGYTQTHSHAMIGNYAKDLGISTSSIFETSPQVRLDSTSVPYDAIATKFSIEAFVNWLLINLDELIRRS